VLACVFCGLWVSARVPLARWLQAGEWLDKNVNSALSPPWGCAGLRNKTTDDALPMGDGGTPFDSQRSAAQAHASTWCVSRSHRDLELVSPPPPLPPPPPRCHPIIAEGLCSPLHPQAAAAHRSKSTRGLSAAFRVRLKDRNLIWITGLTT
jgi:hypothetical protein